MPKTKEWLNTDDVDVDDAFPTIEHFLTAEYAPEEASELTEMILSRLENEVGKRLISGIELQHHFRQQRHIPTGCAGLDKVLEGGLMEGQLAEIYGFTSTGKTQICHRLCAIRASVYQTVTYIDTTNSFNSKRVVELMNGTGNTQQLNVIDVFRIHDAYQLHSMIELLASKYENKHDRPVVIIDSISAVLAAICNYESNQSYALVECIGRGLRSLADRCNVAVLVTNHEVSRGGNALQRQGEDGVPALGNVWRNQVQRRVHVKTCWHDASIKVIECGRTSASMRILKKEIETITEERT